MMHMLTREDGDRGLPPVPAREVDAVTEWVRKGNRPPSTRAAVLVLIVRLWERGQPFPTRPEIAEYLAISEPAIDITLNEGQAEGWLTKRNGTVPGRAKGRASVRQVTFWDPSEQLVAVVHAVR